MRQKEHKGGGWHNKTAPIIAFGWPRNYLTFGRLVVCALLTKANQRRAATTAKTEIEKWLKCLLMARLSCHRSFCRRNTMDLLRKINGDRMRPSQNKDRRMTTERNEKQKNSIFELKLWIPSFASPSSSFSSNQLQLRFRSLSIGTFDKSFDSLEKFKWIVSVNYMQSTRKKRLRKWNQWMHFKSSTEIDSSPLFNKIRKSFEWAWALNGPKKWTENTK